MSQAWSQLVAQLGHQLGPLCAGSGGPTLDELSRKGMWAEDERLCSDLDVDRIGDEVLADVDALINDHLYDRVYCAISARTYSSWSDG